MSPEQTRRRIEEDLSSWVVTIGSSALAGGFCAAACRTMRIDVPFKT
jgi:hypothetical protein